MLGTICKTDWPMFMCWVWLCFRRDDLTVFKEKYVSVCGEKEEAMAEREAVKRELEVSKNLLEKVREIHSAHLNTRGEKK